jgi:hypothetical protein
MSLNWNLTKIANHKTTCFKTDSSGDEVMRGITHTLILTTMAVDLGEITAKNVDEWLVRLQCIARVYSDEGWSSITRQQLTDHIGLSTNVFPNKTRKQFMTKMAKALERECADEVKRIATTSE